MQRNYTRTKAANPNPNMRRNVIILAVAIAAGTTVALLIGFWPSMTVPQDTSHDIQGVNTANRAVNIPENTAYRPYAVIDTFDFDYTAKTMRVFYSVPYGNASTDATAKIASYNDILDAFVFSTANPFKFSSADQLYCPNGTSRIFYGNAYGKTTMTTRVLFESGNSWYLCSLIGYDENSETTRSFISGILALK